MATRNPIENYLKSEDIDSQPYFSKGTSRRGFLKGTVALTGAAVFGEGLLKQIGAWAQDGVKVYIGDIIQGKTALDPTWPNLDSIFYHEIGPKLYNRNFEVSDDQDSIVIYGTITELGKSVRASLQFRKNGKFIGGGGYEVPRGQIEDMMEGLADQIANDLYKITNNKITRSENLQVGKQSPNEVVIEIGNKKRIVDKSKLSKVGFNERIREELKDPEKRDYWIKFYEKHDIGFVDDIPYKILP